MSCCCTGGEPAGPSAGAPGAARSFGLRRTRALIEWCIPITALLLIPKCPACIAAYVLLFTGIGLSFPAAAAVRGVLIGVSIGAIAVLLLRAARRAADWRRERPGAALSVSAASTASTTGRG